MPYVPGDNWVICDLSGKKILMSKSVKTWDGLRVDPAYWYPKHPQLSVRGVPDHMAVRDARPRPVNLYISTPGFGSFTLKSSGGINYIISIDDDGHIVITQGTLGIPVSYFAIGEWAMVISDDGVLDVIKATVPGTSPWVMESTNGVRFNVSLLGAPIYGTDVTYGGAMLLYGTGWIYGTGSVYNEGGLCYGFTIIAVPVV